MEISKTKVAFIGTGVMGAPMAKHLAKAGYNVTVFNRTPAKAKALEPYCQVASDLKTCIIDADFIFTILGFPKDVEEMYLTKDGIIENAKNGAMLIDMTTSSPTLAKKIAKVANEVYPAKNLKVVDAPVTGGDKGAIEATLSIMVGAKEEDFKTLLPLLECMGKTITYMGENGYGQHAKLANQISIAGCLVGCAEALSYAKAQGLNPADLLRVINGGSAASWQSQNNGPKMLEHDYRPGFFLKHLTKDLRLANTEGKNIDLPLEKTVLKIFESLLENNLGDLGTQAVYEYYQTANEKKDK